MHFPHYNYVYGQPAHEFAAGMADLQNNSEITLDFQAIQSNYISITPLQRDQTDYTTAHSLVREAAQLFQGIRFPGFGLIG